MNYYSKAVEHTNKMETLYKSKIQFSFHNSKIYSPDYIPLNLDIININKIEFKDCTTTECIFYCKNHLKGKTAALNFADYEKPGGEFLSGSYAQEEALCYDSFLFNVLSRYKEYYQENRKQLNNFLYYNRAIYSPNIKFFKDNQNVDCDIITCAAPNLTDALMYTDISLSQNVKILDKRIKFILDIANENKVDNLILGAYGCGVFGQNPQIVAKIFKKYLESKKYIFKNVIFAIPDNKNIYGNYTQFLNVFKENK